MTVSVCECIDLIRSNTCMRVSLCGVVITIDHIHVHSQRNTRTERERCVKVRSRKLHEYTTTNEKA